MYLATNFTTNKSMFYLYIFFKCSHTSFETIKQETADLYFYFCIVILNCSVLFSFDCLTVNTRLDRQCHYHNHVFIEHTTHRLAQIHIYSYIRNAPHLSTKSRLPLHVVRRTNKAQYIILYDNI